MSPSTTSSRRLRGLGNLIAGGVCIGLILILALLSLVWTPYDPSFVQASEALQGPSLRHIFGTDNYGQDIFSRIMMGSRVCLIVGVVSVAIGALIGVPLGVWAGMMPRRIGARLMRISDIMYAFPAILLAILLAAAHGSGSTGTAMVAIGISAIPGFARVSHAVTQEVMQQDYIAAARASGIQWVQIAFRHVASNISPTVLVQVSSTFGLAILAEASLSYLGVGTPPTTPSWGRMLFDAKSYLYTQPIQVLWPGLFIAIAVLGFNLLGDGLREALDPRLREIG